MKYKGTFVLALGCLLSATAAYGQATRTWVSGTGSDANPCSRTAPCQTFSGAFSKTATGGEINAIDPGGFGTMNINKSITVDGTGPMASILASNTNGIIINGAGAVVNLRNLVINGAHTTIGNGIRIINAAAVNIDNVTIENFVGAGSDTNGRGISIETTTPDVRVNVTNSNIFNTGRFGIHMAPTAGNVILTVDGVRITNGFVGIQLRQLGHGVITNSLVTNNSSAAVTLELTSASSVITNSTLSNSAYGIFNGNGGSPTTRIMGNTITGNATAGLQINSGQVISSGGNIIRSNNPAGNETPSSTIASQ